MFPKQDAFWTSSIGVRSYRYYYIENDAWGSEIQSGAQFLDAAASEGGASLKGGLREIVYQQFGTLPDAHNTQSA